MASSIDYKKLWEKYQAEGVPNGISIVKFCQMKGISYRSFEKWYKAKVVSEGGIVEVEVMGAPSEENGEIVHPQGERQETVAISQLEVQFTNGLRLSQAGIDYEQFKKLVEKMEVLCLS